MDSSLIRAGLFIILIICLAGCEATATPLPAVLPPTSTPVPIPTLPPPVRYAFTANTVGYVESLDVIEKTGLIDKLGDNTTDMGVLAGYDIVVTLGRIEGWAQSPIFPHVALVLNTSLAPLDSPLAADAVRRSIDPTAIASQFGIAGLEPAPLTPLDPITIRTQLANGGFPDGIDLILRHQTFPGVPQFIDQWGASGVRVQEATATRADMADLYGQKRAHLFLIGWYTPEERQTWEDRVGAENMIDLYSLPISYQAASDLDVTFTDDGFPLGVRRS
jgi:hypothetical protein